MNLNLTKKLVFILVLLCTTIAFLALVKANKAEDPIERVTTEETTKIIEITWL